MATVGANAVTNGQLNVPDRSDRTGAHVVTDGHGRYQEAVLQGRVFYAANVSVATTSVGLSTTYTGLSLANPVGSGVNMVLLYATLMQSVIQSTQVEAYAIATGYNATTNVTHTTPVTPRSALVGTSTTPNGLADSSSTLPTAPFYTMFLTQTQIVAGNAGTVIADLGGSIILAPGAYAAFVTPAQASVAGLWFSFTWEEVSQ